MATNSYAAEFTVLTLDAFAARLRDAPNRGGVLLALRAPGFAQLAWREGRRAALRVERAAAVALRAAATRTLRAGDAIAHQAGSDLFLVALLAPPRSPAAPFGGFRGVLARLCEQLSAALGLELEAGWHPLEPCCSRDDIERQIAAALERGARERERYEFFAAVGHELRTPLTSIRGYIETVLQFERMDGASRRFLETARSEALRMGRMVEGMFEFSLLDLGSVPRQSADVDACARRALEVVEPSARARGIRIEMTSEAARAGIDADLLLQSLVNVLDNSIKYGRDGGRIRVTAAPSGKTVVVLIEDDGPGIEPALRESIFAYRCRGARSAGAGGTGIGLSIVKTIVERAGGNVECGASPAGGAKFTIVLPAGAEIPATAS